MIAEVARLLYENKNILPFGLYITNSVQEEIGLRGAQMIAERIQPNVAIVTDVTHDTTTPMIDQKVQGTAEIGKDTDAFAYSGSGVASALISLPLRYMHTTVEMVHREDVENVIKLIYETLLTIKDGETFSYFE